MKYQHKNACLEGIMNIPLAMPGHSEALAAVMLWKLEALVVHYEIREPTVACMCLS